MAKNMAENITLAANCILCSDPDDGNMITCSKCLHCFHSSCCDLNDDVDIFRWKCQDCVAAIAQQDDSHNPKTLHSTNESSVEVIGTPKQHPQTSTSPTTKHTLAVQPAFLNCSS
ncbi:hypothetical protein FF38_04226 [Lucilia cuprina]|uniref:PHD-type domain-containing protein n=1 Tax=Lucilia cuprina TaxID=7375 RepID=A0A0L0C1G0_LUCCU|nr:hypothetical protein FF38_04226 [Lucilia cuprina]